MSEVDDVTIERDKLRSAITKERADHKAARELLKASRERSHALEQQLAEVAVAKDPTTEKVSTYLSAAVQAQLATATAAQLARINALETELATAKTAADTLKSDIAAKSVETELRKACAEHRVLPTAVNDIITLGKLSLKVGEDGNVATEDGLSAHDFVDEMKSTSPHYWGTAKGSGAKWADGRPPGGMGMSEIGGLAEAGKVGNVFDPTSSAWNLTKQGEILKSDPTLAAKFKAAAGQK